MKSGKSDSPSARPRVGGTGFNPGLGKFDEHLDENAMQQASAQPQPQKPRAVSPKSELKWMGQDIVKGLKSLFNLESALGIDPVKDTPEDQMKKKQLHQRYSKLSREEQDFAQKLFKKKMEKKKQMEEEEERRKRAEEQQKQRELPMPSSPQTGPRGPIGVTRKQKITNLLERQRKMMSGPSGHN